MTITGWTWEHVENEVTMPMLGAFSRYWKSYPPTHLLIAAQLGLEQANDSGTAAEKDRLLAELENIPGGKINVR